MNISSVKFHHLNHGIRIRQNIQQKVNASKGLAKNTIKSLFAEFDRTRSVNDNRTENIGTRLAACSDNRAQAVQLLQFLPTLNITSIMHSNLFQPGHCHMHVQLLL